MMLCRLPPGSIALYGDRLVADAAAAAETAVADSGDGAAFKGDPWEGAGVARAL